MLTLSRKRGERIVINPGRPDEVVIEGIEVGRERARLGILAAPEVRVYRSELIDAPGQHKGDGPCH